MRILSISSLALSLLTQVSFAKFGTTTCKTALYTLKYTENNKKLYLSYPDSLQTSIDYHFDEGTITSQDYFMFFEAYKRALNEVQKMEKALGEKAKDSQNLALLKSNVKALEVMTKSHYFKGLKTDDSYQQVGLYKYYNHAGEHTGTLSRLSDYSDEILCE